MISNPVKRLAVVVAVLLSAVLTALPTVAAAGDCKGVRFQITNRLVGDDGQPQLIRLQRFVIQGPQGVWLEDIRNATVGHNLSFVSDRRRMNRLDSGQVGDFTLYYHHRSPGMAGGGAWTYASFRFQELCSDNKTFFIEIR